jgi:methyl-accepting chemotaxis protein
MSIRSLLLGIFAILSVMIAGFSGISSYRAVERYRGEASFLDGSQAAGMLLKAAALLAVERGLCNAPLHAPEAMPQPRQQEVAETRVQADAALRDGLQRLQQLPELARSRQAIDELVGGQQQLIELRRRVDAALNRPLAERDPEVVGSFAAVMTEQIDRISRLRIVLEATRPAPDAELQELLGLRDRAAEMAERAGRERFVFGGNVAQKHPLGRADLRALSEHRGHVESAWEAIEGFHARSTLPAPLAAAITAVDEEYIHKFEQLRQSVLAVSDTGAYPVPGRDWVDRSGAAIATIIKLSDIVGEIMQNEVQRAASGAMWQAIASLGLMTAGLAFAGAAIWITMGRVLTPLVGMQAAMHSLAQGDLDVDIPGRERSDEIGRMANAMLVFRDGAVEKRRLEGLSEQQQRQAQAVRATAEEERRRAAEEQGRAAEEQGRAIAALSEGLAGMSQGDLTVRLEDGFGETYRQIKDDFNTAISRLQETIDTIAAATREVTNASAEISTSTSDLSRRTEEQVASLEETSASMQQISATVKKNAESARQANVSAGGTRAVADRGGEVVTKAVEAMARIEESSRKISDIISVIDEIARQTNLLALNAAVEAARAGEAGRGFAVVAAEVRSLAQRSSVAAKDIKDLITNSNGQVREGVELVNNAGAALTEIVESIKGVAAIVSEIATVSADQATGLAEVSKALAHMDEVTQKNSTLVEENAATAKALAEQATAMKAHMAFFGSEPTAEAPAAAPAVGNPQPASKGATEPMRAPAGAGGPIGRMRTALATAISANRDWSEF